MRVLQGIVEVQCRKGLYEEAQQSADLAMKSLKADVPEQAKLITTFQELLAKCRPTP